MHVVMLYNINPDWDAADRHEVERETRKLGLAMRRKGHRVSFAPVKDAGIGDAMAPFDPAATIVFNWCESLPGIPHSEAEVIRLLEGMSYTYTGATSRALRLSYDKTRVKKILDRKKIPTPRWTVSRTGDDVDWSCFPAIVKPAREHCSMGMTPRSVVSNRDELKKQVCGVVRKFKQPALVEDFIDGREFHVPLWGNGHIEMLPPVEMDFSAFLDFHNRLCTYDSKFDPESQDYRKIRTRIPVRLSQAEYSQLKRVCTAAYKAVGCRDYGRIDVRLREGEFYVLDVNPNADISADASVALAAQKAGVCYGELGSRLVSLAATRHPCAM